MDIPLKGIREKDFWLQDAMKHRIKYLRIVRKPFKTKWRYFVQLVLEGYSPRKFKKGSGKMGVDPGISTMTVDTEQGMKQHVLAPDVHSYENEVRRASVVYQRRLRAANPDNFNEDGTIRKDSENFHKVWKRTKGIQKALMELKTAHRKLYEYRKQSHGALTNECIRQAGEIVIEPVNYKGLARKAKETSRSDRKSLLKSRDGSVKKVYKYRRRKRFGSSILRHAPASFLSILKQKCVRYGVVVREINPYLVRASQYNHVTGETEKTLLSDRTKRIDGHLVQRDGYSSFLIRHVKTDGETIDRESCKKDFKEYLKHQGREVARKFRSGDPTGCFGLPDFQKRKNVNTIFQTAI